MLLLGEEIIAVSVPEGSSDFILWCDTVEVLISREEINAITSSLVP